MKSFIATFFAVFLVCLVFLVFGGALILENFFASVSLLSLFLSIILTSFIAQDNKIDALEKRVAALESDHLNVER